MKTNHLLAIADAVNDRRRTTEALSLIVGLLDHAGRTGGQDIDSKCHARAALLELFVEKMQADDDLLAGLVRDATPHFQHRP